MTDFATLSAALADLSASVPNATAVFWSNDQNYKDALLCLDFNDPNITDRGYLGTNADGKIKYYLAENAAAIGSGFALYARAPE